MLPFTYMLGSSPSRICSDRAVRFPCGAYKMEKYLLTAIKFDELLEEHISDTEREKYPSQCAEAISHIEKEKHLSQCDEAKSQKIDVGILMETSQPLVA